VSIESIVEKLIPNEDDYIVGYANLENLLEAPLDRYQYGIVVGKRLDDEVIDALEEGPTWAYYQLYLDVNQHLKELVSDIASQLQANKIDSQAIHPTTMKIYRSADYEETLRQKFSHKMVGTRAGLGWIGKTDLFVSKRFGPRLRLASILINEIPPITKQPINESQCGDCDICVKQCPAQAANGKLWTIHVDRDEFYNAFKCRKKAHELSGQLIGIDISLCGICVCVCPCGK